MPIQIIWGNDINESNIYIKNFIKNNVSEIWKNLNYSQINGEDHNHVIRSFEEIQTPPFGDGARVILIRNNPIFNANNNDLSIKFQKILKNIPENAHLILQNIQKPDSRIKITKYLKTLIKEGKAKEISFSLPDFWDYNSQIEYIKNTANKLNIEIDQNTAILILESLGNDSFSLLNELKKAKLYLTAVNKNDDSKIILKSNDVKKIFNNHQSNIFKIIDYLLEKNIHKSLIEINYLIQKGEPALKLNAGLISQFRMLTIVLLLTKSNEKDISKICKLANISNPKRIFFIRKKVKNISPEFLIKIMINLLNIESWLKKGKNPMNVFTENLINLT